MLETCSRPFDESLLSGYVDRALTQGDAQRVRVHLDDCAECRALVADLQEFREATMKTEFVVPDDGQWNERPLGAVSRSAFTIGWAVLIVWAVAMIGFALGQAWSDSQGWLERLAIFGGLSGVALLFVSVLIDRLVKQRTDRYTEVKK